MTVFIEWVTESLTYSIRSKNTLSFAIYTECNKIRNILVKIFGGQASVLPLLFFFLTFYWHFFLSGWASKILSLAPLKESACPKQALIEPCGSSTVYLGPTHITNCELCVVFTHRRTSMLTTCLHADVRVSVMSKWNGRSLVRADHAENRLNLVPGRLIGAYLEINTIMVKSWKLLWKWHFLAMLYSKKIILLDIYLFWSKRWCLI